MFAEGTISNFTVTCYAPAILKVYRREDVLRSSYDYMDHTLQRQYTENTKQIFPEIKLCGPLPDSYTFMFLSAIYIFPQSVCLLCCRKIGGPTVGIYKSLTDNEFGIGTEAMQFLFWECINWILCSAAFIAYTWFHGMLPEYSHLYPGAAGFPSRCPGSAPEQRA